MPESVKKTGTPIAPPEYSRPIAPGFSVWPVSAATWSSRTAKAATARMPSSAS